MNAQVWRINGWQSHQPTGGYISSEHSPPCCSCLWAYEPCHGGLECKLGNRVFVPQEGEAILGIPLNSRMPDDKLIWAESSNRLFNVHSAYKLMKENYPRRRVKLATVTQSSRATSFDHAHELRWFGDAQICPNPLLQLNTIVYGPLIQGDDDREVDLRGHSSYCYDCIGHLDQ